MLKAPHSERNNRMRRKGLNIFTLLSYEKSAFIKKEKIGKMEIMHFFIMTEVAHLFPGMTANMGSA